MPGKVGVKIKAGRNLPVMDRGSDTTDAFVEIKLGNTTHKTDVCRKSLNPQFNTDWFRFEVDDAELQDEPLQIRLMDHDTYSANDAIGKVNISLNALCLDTNIAGQTSHGKGTVLSGWIPVFDTMHGIRGEVYVIVKVDLFSDLNKFRQSSCGIPFFHSPCVPHGYRAQIIHGFVEELVVNDDPEYQWIDKIRTPRASNEARQLVFLNLSGQLQRKMGLKVINMGANAVIGYKQCFDLEGDVGVVVRGIGTAVTLIKDMSCSQQLTSTTSNTATQNALIEEFSKEDQSLSPRSIDQCKVSSVEVQKADIQKYRTASEVVDFDRQSSFDTEDDAFEMMLSLMRQEDERGEKPVPKIKHQVRRFTRSSRDLFNAKYNAIRRKMGNTVNSKSQDDMSLRRYGSFLSAASIGGKIGIDESISLPRNSFYYGNQRKSSSKLKQQQFSRKSKVSGIKSHELIQRSISDSSSVKNYNNYVPDNYCEGISEFQPNCRSSPDLVFKDTAFKNLNPLYLHDIPKTVEKFNDETESSTTTASLTFTDATSTATDESCMRALPFLNKENETLDVKQAKAQNLAQFLKIIDEEDKENECWIKPGQTSLDDESFPDLTKKSSYASKLLNDLKEFSQQIQCLIKTKKSTNVSKKSSKSSSHKPHHTLPNNFLSVPNPELYYSQPEFLIEKTSISNEYNIYDLPSISSSIKHSRSLVDLKSYASYTSDAESAASIDDTAICFRESYAKSCHVPPILQICPSTPTPTPSESDHSQINSKEQFIPPCIVIEEHNKNLSDSISLEIGFDNSMNSGLVIDNKQDINLRAKNSLIRCANRTSSFNSNNRKCESSLTSQSSLISSSSLKSVPSFENISNIPLTHFNSDISQCKTDVKSLLVPSYSTKSNDDKTTGTGTVDKTLSSPSSPVVVAAVIPNHHYRSHHRSLNDISSNGTFGHSDSPSMKRFTSAASAAIVASAASNIAIAAAANASTTATTTSTVPTNARGALLESNSKLSPSPPKMTMIATENIFSTTGTTMIPKDTGEICRRSSDSDLSVTPKGNSICVASERLVAATVLMRLNQTVSCKNPSGANTDSIDTMLEYPFLTMTKFPTGFILHLGATVAARSVKLLERVPNPDEPEVRDSWWTELRMEIRSHARALGCNVVLGYTESTTISDDVCVLSATGTAAVINMSYNRSISQHDIYTTIMAKSSGMSASLEERDINKETRNSAGSNDAKDSTGINSSCPGGSGVFPSAATGRKNVPVPPLNVIKTSPNCTICHVPYNLTSVPFNVKMKKCAICRKGRVPDVLLATLEVPKFVHITGRACFIQSQVVRAKKDLRSELNAKEISDGLPFLEYELHRVLINKLKAKGMNAIFGLRTQVAIGERMIALIATGTALFLSALPVPQVPRIVAGNSWTDKQKLNELQKKLQETYKHNQEFYRLKCIDPDMVGQSVVGEVNKVEQSDTDESDDEVIEIDLNCGNKDTCVLEVDDIEDLEIISLLMEPNAPEGFYVVNTQTVPGLADIEAVRNLQMFTQIWRAKLDVGQQTINGFSKHFQRILQTIYFKLRTMVPCAICDLRFRLDLPESDQIQLLVTGMVLGLEDESSIKDQQRSKMQTGPAINSLQLTVPNTIICNPDINGTQPIYTDNGSEHQLQEQDYIFPLDEDQMIETPTRCTLPPYGTNAFQLRKPSPSFTTSKMNALLRNRCFPLCDRFGIDISPLASIPGARIEKYLGNLNFFFIRECTSIRENGGISGFVHSFVTELLAVVRAHIAALGGNAMVAFYMNELILVDNQHKNQGQCLISIGGDAINVSYNNDEGN